MIKKIIFFLITLITITGIGYFIIEYVRKDNREKYQLTAECENSELNYCKEIFEIGISYSEFENLLEQKSIEIFFEWKNENTEFIELRNILKECQLSGRQYCGITFEFKKSKLIDIYAGYPCH